MFCPKCGKDDQIGNTYCRQCGEFLPDLTENMFSDFKGENPHQNLKIFNGLNIFMMLITFLSGLWAYSTEFTIPFINYILLVVVSCNIFLNLANFLISKKLLSFLTPKKEKNVREQIEVQESYKQELLSQANFEDFVPVSVTKTSTRKLKEKIKRST